MTTSNNISSGMNTNIKERESNIELLRLLAMFLVLVVHSDFFTLKPPSQDAVISSPLNAATRFFFESASIVCVDTFVLISGWFAIKPKAKSFCNFIFQCLFFFVGIYAVMLMTGQATLSLKGIAGCLVLLKDNWFIKAYIGLYILAPVLNAFVKNADKRTFLAVLVSFFVFQTIYGWIGTAQFFANGYSTMSFIGLYLLARYVKIHTDYKKITPQLCFAVYVGLTVIISAIAFFSTRVGVTFISGKQYSYTSPLVIVSALSLLLLFDGLKVKSRFVNWCAASSFAIFLLHTNPNLCERYFKSTVMHLYNNYDGVSCLVMIFIFLLVVSVVAILIDQVRKSLWKTIAKRWFRIGTIFVS